MEETGEMLPKEGSNRKYYLLVALFSCTKALLFLFPQYWWTYAFDKGVSSQYISMISSYIHFLNSYVIFLLLISILFFAKKDKVSVDRFVIARIFIISVVSYFVTISIFNFVFYEYDLNFMIWSYYPSILSSLVYLPLYVLILFFPKERVVRKKAGIFAIISAIWFPIFPMAIPIGLILTLGWSFFKEKNAATLTGWSFLGGAIGGFITTTLNFFLNIV